MKRFVLWGLALMLGVSAHAASNELAELKKLSVEELFQIQVTSVSRQPEMLSEAASAIQVITGDDIRRSGVVSIPEALRLADNLNVAQKNSSDYAISARGFNGSVSGKMLVLIDGRSVYDPLFSGVIWNMQDYLLEDIERIEVISGPGGAIWGANAVNGVINIISKNARDTQGLYLEAGGGTPWQDFAGLRYGGMLSSNVYYRVYGKYFDHVSAVLSNGNDAGDAWWRGQGGFRMDAMPSELNTFTLQGDGYGGDIDTPGLPGVRIDGGNVLGRWQHRFYDDSNLALQIYYDRANKKVPFAGFGTIPSGFLEDNLDTVDVDFQHHFQWGERQDIVWGLGYRFTHDVIDPAPVVVFLPRTLDHHLYSAFVQDKVKLLDRLFLTLGTKLEYNDYTGFEVEPNVRLQYNLTDQHTFWGAVSRAVRMPSRYDRDLFQPDPAFATFLTANRDFQSENVLAYEVGYRGHLGRRVTTTLSGFYNVYEHLRSLGFQSGSTLPIEFQNNNEGTTYGFEFTLNYQPLEWWRFHAGYTLLKADIHVVPGRIDLSNSLGETADPQQQFSLRTAVDIGKNVQFDLGCRWVDRLPINNNGAVNIVPAYFEMNARLAWRIHPNVEVSVVGQNLLHDHHPEYGAATPAREEIERSVYGKVSCRF